MGCAWILAHIHTHIHTEAYSLEGSPPEAYEPLTESIQQPPDSCVAWPWKSCFWFSVWKTKRVCLEWWDTGRYHTARTGTCLSLRFRVNSWIQAHDMKTAHNEFLLLSLQPAPIPQHTPIISVSLVCLIIPKVCLRKPTGILLLFKALCTLMLMLSEDRMICLSQGANISNYHYILIIHNQKNRCSKHEMVSISFILSFKITYPTLGTE